MKIFKKIASVAVATAIVATGVFVSAAPAMAAPIAGATLTITPTSGNVNTDTYFLNSIAASAAAPVGYRALGGTVIFQDGVRLGAISSSRTTAMPSTAGTNGLDGNTPVFMDRSISPTNNFVSSRLLNDPFLSNLVPGGLHTGEFELRFYYFASSTAPDYNDPYISLTLEYNATTGAWGLPAAPAIATTVALTASITANAGEVALAATVKDGAATATAAAGNIVFKEGTTIVASVAVASGEANALLTGIADGAHTYTAEFVPSDAVYAGSVSGNATVNLGSPAPQGVNIQVAIPAGVGTLTLTGVSTTVNMGTATLAGGTLNATGTVNAVVTDTRQLEYPAWNLTGQVGNFTSGAKVLAGKYLGWTPAVTGDSVFTGAGTSVAGAVVQPDPGTANGLASSRTFASGQPNETGTVTNASALLQLKAPSNTPAGAYSATLTLTLI